MVRYSLIIPVYNGAKLLPPILNVLARLPEKEIEYLLIDDGSTDTSLTLLRGCSHKDPRFRIYSVPHEGTSSARNFGMRHARGTFLFFCDQDDLLSPVIFSLGRSLQAQYPGALITWSYTTVCSELQLSEFVPRIKYFSAGRVLNYYETKMFHPVWNKLFTSACLRQHPLLFSPAFRFGDEDFDFMVRYFETFPQTPVVHIQQPLYYWNRKNPHSTLLNYQKSLTYAGYCERKIEYFRYIMRLQNCSPKTQPAILGKKAKEFLWGVAKGMRFESMTDAQRYAILELPETLMAQTWLRAADPTSPFVEAFEKKDLGLILELTQQAGEGMDNK